MDRWTKWSEWWTSLITGDAVADDNPLAILHASDAFAAVVARVAGRYQPRTLSLTHRFERLPGFK